MNKFLYLCLYGVLNVGCRAEIGRFPIKIYIVTKILKYWIHLDSLDVKKL